MSQQSSDDRQARLGDSFGGAASPAEPGTPEPKRDEPETAGAATAEPESPTQSARSSTNTAGDGQSDTWGSDSTVAQGAGTGEATVHGPDGIDSWISTRDERGESYGVFEIGLRVVSDLSGTERSIVTEKRVEHPGDSKGQPHMQFGWGSAEPDEVIEAARTWKLGHASLPYVPELNCDAYPRPARTIPADRFRIFVADEVYEALRETGHEDVAKRLAATVDALNDLDEHRPSEAYIDTMEEAQSVAAEAGAGSHTGSLRRRKRQIENTIRAKLDFSKRYGSGTPDPHPEFADNDLNTLQQLLEDTEAEQTQAEARLENLKDQLATAREEWLEQTRATLPSLHR